MSNVVRTKKVTVFSTQGQPFTIETSASTWGELQSSVSNKVSNLSGMRAIVQATKQTLELSEAAIPDNDFVLFLTPKQVKSGNITKEEILSLPYNVLRSSAAKLGIAVHGSKKEIQDRFIGYIEHKGLHESKNPKTKTSARIKETREITVSDVVGIAKNFNSKSIDQKIKILKERLLAVKNNTFTEYTIDEINEVRARIVETTEHISICETKLERLDKVAVTLTNLVEDILTVDAEIVSDDEVVSPGSDLDLDKAKAEFEFLNMVETPVANTDDSSDDEDNEDEDDSDEEEVVTPQKTSADNEFSKLQDKLQAEFNSLLNR